MGCVMATWPTSADGSTRIGCTAPGERICPPETKCVTGLTAAQAAKGRKPRPRLSPTTGLGSGRSAGCQRHPRWCRKRGSAAIDSSFATPHLYALTTTSPAMLGAGRPHKGGAALAVRPHAGGSPQAGCGPPSPAIPGHEPDPMVGAPAPRLAAPAPLQWPAPMPETPARCAAQHRIPLFQRSQHPGGQGRLAMKLLVVGPWPAPRSGSWRRLSCRAPRVATPRCTPRQTPRTPTAGL